MNDSPRFDERNAGDQPPTTYVPQNVEAEAALLGGLMISNQFLDMIPQLRGEHFFEPLHGEIFESIRDRISEGKVANPVTMRPRWETDSRIKKLGGAGYLAQLTGTGAALVGLRDFAEQIIELSELRRVRAQLYEAIEFTEDGTNGLTASVIVADLEAALVDCLDTDIRQVSVDIEDAFDVISDEIEKTSEGAPPAGFEIARLHDYNHVRGRMEPGDFDLLGGRPSMGKTALALTIALGAAEAGIGTEFLSLEMDRRKTTRRALATMIYRPDGATYQQIIEGKLRREDWAALVEAREKMKDMPLSISDPKEMMIEDLVPFLRKRKRVFERKGRELKFVVIDYLTRFGTRKKLNSETEIVSYISRMLKAAAKDLDLCLLVLTQLSRALESRDNKRPMLADLRQSGSLEQDADNVIFIYRDEYYQERVEPPKDKPEKWQKWAEEIAEVRDNIEIYSSKRREGPLSKRIAKFYTRHQAVRDHGDYADAPSFFDDDRDDSFGGPHIPERG